MIKRIESKPQTLLLVDAYGALLSSFLLGIVLVNLQEYVGIPIRTLYFLAVIPIFFAIYDFYHSKKEWNQVSPYLRGIAIMNIIYCLLSISFAFYHSNTITMLGWIYILVEVCIVLTLAIFEWRIAYKISVAASK